MLYRAQRLHVLFKPDCVLPVMRGAQHVQDRVADHLGPAFIRIDNAGYAKSSTSLRITRLVAAGEWDGNHRQPLFDARHDRAESAMRDHRVAMRQQQRVRNIPLDPDIGRLRAKRVRMLVATDRNDQVDIFVSQSIDNGFEDPWRAMENRTQAGMYGRSRRQLCDPAGQDFCAGLIEAYRAEKMHRWWGI